MLNCLAFVGWALVVVSCLVWSVSMLIVNFSVSLMVRVVVLESALVASSCFDLSVPIGIA